MKRINNEIAVQLTGVNKKYEIHHEKPTLVEKFVKGKNEFFWALKDINLKIFKGEKVGIIGPNGSGKTTILKIITGITSPTSGMATVYGRIVSLIDMEAGFHPDLTGLQNIYLNASLLGMRKKETELKLNSIIQFADLKQFIDVPFFTYSNGMKLRLGFSVAIHSDPDILIIDEGFSVGDKQFQIKTKGYIEKFFKNKKTIILVSHWLDFVKEHCDRILLMRQGSIIEDGLSREVIGKYLDTIKA